MRATLLSDVRPCIAPPLAYKAPIRIESDKIRHLPASVLIPRGKALFWQDELQDRRIQIVEGVVRAVRLLENGNRQILAFYWPGDTLPPVRWTCQRFTAEAVTDCRVLRTPVLDPCNHGQPCGVERVLTDTLSLVLIMGQKSITQRIAWFLLRIRRHLREDPKRPRALQILIPRADIADHLGTSLETVCRALAEFKTRKLIDLPTRKTIRFIDLPGLARLAGE